MNKVILDKKDSTELLAINNGAGANIVLVAGNNDIDLLLSYAALDVKSREERCVFAVSKFNTFDNDYMLKIWNYLQDDKTAKSMFLGFLTSILGHYNDVCLLEKIGGTFIAVGDRNVDFSYASLDDIGEWYKYLFEIALKAFIVSDGVLLVNNLNINISIDKYKHLFVYLAEMAVYRNNMVIVATDLTSTVKAFHEFAKEADINTALVTIKGNNASNCKIFETAVKEHQATSDFLAFVSA